MSLEDTSKVHHHLGIIQRFFLWILLEFVIGGYFRGLSSLGDTSKVPHQYVSVHHLEIRKGFLTWGNVRVHHLEIL